LPNDELSAMHETYAFFTPWLVATIHMWC
jgi:hypothetical protein